VQQIFNITMKGAAINKNIEFEESIFKNSLKFCHCGIPT
jgi:hypothetical protein